MAVLSRLHGWLEPGAGQAEGLQLCLSTSSGSAHLHSCADWHQKDTNFVPQAGLRSAALIYHAFAHIDPAFAHIACPMATSSSAMKGVSS